MGLQCAAATPPLLGMRWYTKCAGARHADRNNKESAHAGGPATAGPWALSSGPHAGAAASSGGGRTRRPRGPPQWALLAGASAGGLLHAARRPARRVNSAPVAAPVQNASERGLYGPRVRPGKVSPIREVPAQIPRPRYLRPGARVDPVEGLPWHPFLHVIEIKEAPQIEAMRDAGALAREALEVVGRLIAPGVTPDELDAALHDFVVARGAYPSPLGYLGFPKSLCTSVNDIIAHGIPDDRPLEEGDILNADVTVYVSGHHGDTSSMFLVGRPEASARGLCRAAQRAMMAGIEVCGPGIDFREVGERIQAVADAARCHCSELFVGHGIGNYFHGAPEVIPVVNNVDQGLMRPGMTFTVEPILVEHNDDTYERWDDNWTIQTATGARAAQFEHTILITDRGYEILTGPSIDYEALGRR